MRFELKVLGLSALVIGFTAASTWSVRLACADYWVEQKTVPATSKAIAILPGQAAGHFQLAVLVSGDNAQRVRQALRRAVDLNPSDARSWIELGLRYESDGDAGSAEGYLLRAAEEDKLYLPRWTLANYYFRRNDMTRFWAWAKESAGAIYGDPQPLFRLCGRVAEDGNLIDRLTIQRPDVQIGYIYYLLNQNRVDLIHQPIRHLLDGNRPADLPVLLTACDRLLAANRGPEALELWNELADAHRVPFGRLSLGGGTSLTNGNFAVSPTSRGFDWRLPAVDGIAAAAEENPSGLRITFSGSQPEGCEPLVQFAPVRENTKYKLRSRYRTAGIPVGAGLDLQIRDMNGAILREGAGLSSGADAQTEASFVTPASCHLVRLSLAYQRSPGTTRIDGFVVLQSVELEPVKQLP